MSDPVKPAHLMSLTESDLDDLAARIGRRLHLTPREQRLSQALHAVARGHQRRIKLKVKAATR